MAEDLQAAGIVEEGVGVVTAPVADVAGGEAEEKTEAEDAKALESADERTPEAREAAIDAALDKHSADVARMARALRSGQTREAALKAENEQLRAQTADREPDTAGRVAPQPKVAADGLTVDDDGNVVLDGEILPPKFARKFLAQDKDLAELKAFAEEMRGERQNAVIAQHTQAFEKSVDAALEGVRKAAFPWLPDEKIGKVDRVLKQSTDDILAADPEFREALEANDDVKVTVALKRAAKQAIAEFTDLFGIPAKMQKADNEEFADKHRVKPGGTEGVKAPNDPDQMTPTERRAWAAQVRRATEAARAERT
jgi:hypothetical protein